MTPFNRFFVSLVVAGLFIVNPSVSVADEPSSQDSYGSKVGQKAARTFANIGTAWLEIPKNMINISNQSNVFYGAVGGMFKGMVHMAGRLGVAIADLITLPLPTKAIAHPIYIWENFDIDTTYGDAFRYDPSQNAMQPQSIAPVSAPQPAKSTVAPPVYNNDYSNQDTNTKLDTVFKKEMMK
jgi:putative exosortase-associated protein (TIGR04073 family)